VKQNAALAPYPGGRYEPRVSAYSLDPAGRSLVYRAWQDIFGVDELYAVVPARYKLPAQRP
jgi:hypothetical protein